MTDSLIAAQGGTGAVIAGLGELVAARLVRVDAGGYRFSQLGWREVLCVGLEPDTRAELHRRVALALERKGANPLRVIQRLRWANQEDVAPRQMAHFVRIPLALACGGVGRLSRALQLVGAAASRVQNALLSAHSTRERAAALPQLLLEDTGAAGGMLRLAGQCYSLRCITGARRRVRPRRAAARERPSRASATTLHSSSRRVRYRRTDPHQPARRERPSSGALQHGGWMGRSSHGGYRAKA